MDTAAWETLFPHRQGIRYQSLPASIHGVLLKLTSEAADIEGFTSNRNYLLGKDEKGDTT